MGKLYHGSNQKNLTRLEPNNSTHGKYVYATPYKELAMIFSARCGDDCVYALFRNEKSDPWTIVERIPGALKTMFDCSSSIYTLDDTTFKDIHTGFSEVVSEVGVDITSEEQIDNLYEEIKKLAHQGKVKIYYYPNKPKEIPIDNSDLIEKHIAQNKRMNKPVTKESFERIILLHPNLIEKVNQKMEELKINEKPFQKEDLPGLFENAVIRQAMNSKQEQYLKSSLLLISKFYPELGPLLKEKLSFFSKSKNEKIDILFQKCSMMFPDIPSNMIEKAKSRVLKDERSFSKIGREIIEFATKVRYVEKIISSPINQEILDNSILLIGPMGTGKTTVSKKLSEVTGYPLVSLDNREQLSQYYRQAKNFNHFKEFEFYLTSSVLTTLNEPSIIDFGAGHSIYENEIMFYEMKKLIQRFKNIELLLSSQNLEEAKIILNERIKKRRNKIEQRVLENNKHFIESPCNYELASDTCYTYDKTPDEIAMDIFVQIQNKSRNRNF